MGRYVRSALAQGREKWQAPLNAVMNFWVPQNVGEFLDEFWNCRLLISAA